MALRISVFASKDLLATIQLLKGIDKEIAKQTRRAIKEVTSNEWQEAVRGNTTSASQVRVLSDTARVAVSNQNIVLKSAAIGKSLSGGSKPPDLAHSVEFGADHDSVLTYQSHSRTGREFTVHNRHVRNQFKPRNLKGYVVYPAAARIIPRIAALFVATTVRTIHEAIEGGSK